MEWTMEINNIQKDGAMAVKLKVVIQLPWWRSEE
jgi:hypothetical protein